MSEITVVGGRKLSGRIFVQGAKNSVLPILSACLVCNQPCRLHNCPRITDVDAAIAILEYLGCKVTWQDHTLLVDPTQVRCREIPHRLMAKMRSSIVFLGAVLARCGSSSLSFPGGCEIGARPIDLHLSSLSQMGLKVEESHGRLACRVTGGRLHGAEIILSIPSVGATENIMIAASTAMGTTVIHNAAREPEIGDLARFINACGGKVYTDKDGTVTIEGVPALQGATHRIIPDRIVATTYMAALAVTGGKGVLEGVEPHHLHATLPLFRQSGCQVMVKPNSICLEAPERLRAIPQVITGYYPGFPTDAQPILMAMATVAKGTGIFVENIFENRFRHTPELCRLGARIKVEGRMAVVEGVPRLSGARVKATDLRGGAALLIAGLCAEGKTTVTHVPYINRGYENITEGLSALGAEVYVVKDKG